MKYQLFFVIFSITGLFSQNTDIYFTKNLSYSKLYEGFLEYRNENDSLSELYIKSYLFKAKMDNDKKQIIEGYKLLGSLKTNDVRLKYLDSALNIVEKDISLKWYSASLNYDKGIVYYKKRSFRSAINHFLKSNSIARTYNFSDLKFDSNYMIAILTDRIGNHKESIQIHEEYLEYIKNKKEIDSLLYLKTLFGLVVASYKSGEVDDASYYIDIGIKTTKKIKNQEQYNFFLLSSGVVNYYKKEYSRSLDSINKSLKYFISIDNKPNLAVAYYYKGKVLYEKGEEQESLNCFKRVDTIFDIQKDILPEIREGYQMLINYYRKSNNLKEQLFYTNKLLEVDSVLGENYKYLQANIIKDYYTPILIEKKVKTKSKFFWLTIYIAIVLLILSLIAFFYSNFKKKLYKKKFEAIISEKNKNIEKPNILEERNKKKTFNIPEEILTGIINNLEHFEKEHRYTNSKYTLAILAKEFNTNSSYLSKTINVIKQKSFSQYINDLRVDYTINILKSSDKFDLYSIKGIAEEVGFKSSESFSKAFNKKTGIYPSYFIKHLKKES